MRLSELIDGLNVLDSNVNPDMDVSLITSDSREIIPLSIFFAVKGSKNDGLNFVSDAISRDAVVFLDREVRQI